MTGVAAAGSRIPAAVVAACVRRRREGVMAVKGLEPEVAVETDAAVVDARVASIAEARYISVDARPFDARLPQGAPAPLYFVAYEFESRGGHRCVRILAAYNVRIDKLRYHPLDVVIRVDKATAEIRNIAAMPGIASGTTLVGVATALCRYMGARSIELFDASERTCETGTAAHGYTHWLMYLRGTGFYHAFGFRPLADKAWRRTVERLHRLKTADVLEALRRIDKGRRHPFIQWLEWSAHPPVFADAITTMTCEGFAAFESFVSMGLQDSDYPLLLTPIVETYYHSMGQYRWNTKNEKAKGGGGGKQRSRTVLYKQKTYKLVRVSDQQIRIVLDNHEVTVKVAPKATMVTAERLTPALLDFLRYMAQTAWKTRRLDFAYEALQYIPHPRLPASGFLFRQDLSEYATPAETDAAVADALRYIRAVDWEAYLDRVAAWNALPGAYNGYIEFVAQGDIERLHLGLPLSADKVTRLIERARKALQKAGARTLAEMGWNQAAVTFCNMVFEHVLPHVWIAGGVRYMDRALWKAVSTVTAHVEGWYVDVGAAAATEGA